MLLKIHHNCLNPPFAKIVVLIFNYDNAHHIDMKCIFTLYIHVLTSTKYRGCMLITPPLGSALKWHYKQHGAINSSILLMLGGKSQKKYGVINSKMLYHTGVIISSSRTTNLTHCLSLYFVNLNIQLLNFINHFFIFDNILVTFLAPSELYKSTQVFSFSSSFQHFYSKRA